MTNKSSLIIALTFFIQTNSMQSSPPGGEPQKLIPSHEQLDAFFKLIKSQEYKLANNSSKIARLKNLASQFDERYSVSGAHRVYIEIRYIEDSPEYESD